MPITFQTLARISLIVLLILGCLFVLAPFLAAILFAAIICVTTWPFYRWLHRRFGGRDTLAAAGMTLLLIFVMLVPTIFLAMGLHDAVSMLTATVQGWVKPETGTFSGMLAERLRELPYVGEYALAYWQRISSNQEEAQKILQTVYLPTQNIALKSIAMVSYGILQMALMIFVSFFLFRDGVALVQMLKNIAERLGGALGIDLLALSRTTVISVMAGIVGTALVQALVAHIGFIVAGVPGAILLSIATFFLSLIPFGPPLAWGTAAFLLYSQGETGWAIFMALYGFCIISSVDNVLKPILISHNSRQPILLVVLGVFGGILAFGFIGIFLGPTLLALGDALLRRWLATRESMDETEHTPEGTA